MNRLDLTDLIPEYLFQDLLAAAIYSYFVRFAKPIVGSTATESYKKVELREYEVACDRKNICHTFNLDEPSVVENLKKLKDLGVIDFRQLDNLLIVSFKNISLPMNELSYNNSNPVHRQEIFLSAFIDKHLEWVKGNLGEKSYENYARVFKHLSEFKGDCAISELKNSDLEEFKTTRRKEVEATTVNIDVRTLKAALEKAVDWRFLVENPFRRVSLMRVERKQAEFLTQDEFIQLVKSVREENLKYLIVFAALTGLRRGEIVYLQWRDIDLVGRKIIIQSSEYHKTKMGGSRVIPLSTGAQHVINSIQERFDPFVFSTANGEHFKEEYVTRKFKEYLRKNEFNENYHFHSLRKCFATWAKEAGTDLYVLKGMLGHKDVRTTEIYTGIPEPSMVKAAESVSNMFELGLLLGNHNQFSDI